MYLPETRKGNDNIPVVIFVSGGAWSMKNKEMYGLLCSEMANKLQVVVCCPNYSAYPKVNIIIDWVLKVNHLHFPSHGLKQNHISWTWVFIVISK